MIAMFLLFGVIDIIPVSTTTFCGMGWGHYSYEFDNLTIPCCQLQHKRFGCNSIHIKFTTSIEVSRAIDQVLFYSILLIQTF